MSQQQRPARPPMRRGPGFGPPGGPPGAPVEKAKDFKGTLRKLAAYLKPHMPKIIMVWTLAIMATVFSIVNPKIQGKATDELADGLIASITGTGGVNMTAIGQILLTVLVLYLTSALLFYFQGYVMSGVSMKITYQLRKEISEKIHRLPISYYDKTTHGEVLSRITNDVDTLSGNLNNSATQIITSITSLIGILIMMLTINVKLTLVALCVIPLSLICIALVVKASQKHFVKQQEYLGHVNGHIEEMYGAHGIVKAFGREASSVETFNGYNGQLYHSAWKSQFLSGLMMPIIGFIGNIGYVVICLLGGYYAVQKVITIGDIQAFISYVRQFTQPMSQMAQISNVLQQTVAAAERVFSFLEETEETPDSVDAIPVIQADKAGSSVTFKNVRFGYSPEKTVISDFSAHIEPGQTVAIVGPTGAGKTTIVKLLMRFYDLDSGAICIDEHDLLEYKRNDVRGLFGMVLQDTWLFNGTIAENIRYGKLDATDEEIHAAAVAAQVDHFVRTLPEGYDMVLNEEANNVSQGQKQLLTIARAILADPEILILDEATSSVDTRTEVMIQKAMQNLMRGRTSFIIAHRLSTIRGADLILVMRDGDIVEQGNHEELLAAGGFYASLYNSQFEQAG